MIHEWEFDKISYWRMEESVILLPSGLEIGFGIGCFRNKTIAYFINCVANM